MKRIIAIFAVLMTVLMLASCYSHVYLPLPGHGSNDNENGNTETPDEPYEPAENAEIELRGDITVAQVNEAFTNYDTVAFEGTITVKNNETLEIPANKSLIGINTADAIIEGDYSVSAGISSLVNVSGTLDNVTVRLSLEESFENWNNETFVSTRNQTVSMTGGKLKNSIVTNGRNGIHFHTNNCDGSVVENTEVFHNRTGISVQIASADTKNITIKDNNIYENETIGIVFMTMGSSALNGEFTADVTNNVITDNWYSNIEIRKSAEADYTVTLSSNNFDGNGPNEAMKTGKSGSGEHDANTRYDDFFNGGSSITPTPTFVANIVYTTFD